MPSEEEITPEEKLLRVIQKNGAEDGNAESAELVAGGSDAEEEPETAGLPPPVLAVAESEDDIEDEEPAAPDEEGDEEDSEAEQSPVGEAGVVFGAASGQAVSFRAVFRSMFGGGGKHGATLPRSLTLSSANHYLGILIPVLAVFILYDVYRLSADKPDVTELMGRMSGGFGTAQAATGEFALAPLDVYLQPVRQRSFFKPIDAPGQDPVAPPEPTVPAWIEYVRSSLTLLGTSWNPDNPVNSEAIVKDSKADTVWFLKRGQKVGQKDIEVKQVFQDRIILSSEGQETELR